MLDHELNAFGMRMGLPGLAFSPQGLVALDVSGMGRLYFEKQNAMAKRSCWSIWPAPSPRMTAPCPNGPWPCAITGMHTLFP